MSGGKAYLVNHVLQLSLSLLQFLQLRQQLCILLGQHIILGRKFVHCFFQPRYFVEFIIQFAVFGVVLILFVLDILKQLVLGT